MNEIITLDEQALLAINSLHTDYWDMIMYLISSKWLWIPFYAAIIFAIWRSYGWRTAVMAILVTALTITAADQICSHLIRPFTQRLRPSNLDNPLSAYVHVVNSYRGGRYGFPSSHASNTFALAMLTCLIFRRLRYSIFIFLWAVLVCYSRMYLGVHYPGDILVGATIGLICGWVLFLATGGITRALAKRNPDSGALAQLTKSWGAPSPTFVKKESGNAMAFQVSDVPIIVAIATLFILLVS